jgi:hypothetical protein
MYELSDKVVNRLYELTHPSQFQWLVSNDDWKASPVRANAFFISSEKRASSAAMPPADALCVDIFSPPPGDSGVISQVERLSSKETKWRQDWFG